jgi:hypothetical protein
MCTVARFWTGDTLSCYQASRAADAAASPRPATPPLTSLPPPPPPPLTRSGASSHLAGGLARGDPPSSRLVGGLARRDPLLCLGLLPGARLLHRALLLRGLLGRWLLLCLGCRLCGDCG